MSIYDKTKMMCRTWIESVNNLFNMGKDLETEVDGLKGGIVKDVTLTEVDKHYTLTILYDDNTSDIVTWDDSTVGIEDITLIYSDGTYILTVILTDGTRYTFSIPVGNVVTEEELTALNLGTPDDTASSTGSLWARMKNAVNRILSLEGSVDSINTSITTMNVGTPDDTASSTGSLWARMKDSVNRILSLENAVTVKPSITDLPDMSDGATIHAINIYGNTSDSIFIVSLKRINAFWYTGTCHGLVIDGVSYDHDYAITLAYDYPTIVPNRMTLTWDDNGTRKTKVFENITTLGFGVSNH